MTPESCDLVPVWTAAFWVAWSVVALALVVVLWLKGRNDG